MKFWSAILYWGYVEVPCSKRARNPLSVTCDEVESLDWRSIVWLDPLSFNGLKMAIGAFLPALFCLEQPVDILAQDTGKYLEP